MDRRKRDEPQGRERGATNPRPRVRRKPSRWRETTRAERDVGGWNPRPEGELPISVASTPGVDAPAANGGGVKRTRPGEEDPRSGAFGHRDRRGSRGPRAALKGRPRRRGSIVPGDRAERRGGTGLTTGTVTAREGGDRQARTSDIGNTSGTRTGNGPRSRRELRSPPSSYRRRREEHLGCPIAAVPPTTLNARSTPRELSGWSQPESRASATL